MALIGSQQIRATASSATAKTGKTQLTQLVQVLYFQVLQILNVFIPLSFPHLVLVHARPASCSVSQSLVATWTVGGASGAPGRSARIPAAEGSNSGGATVTTRRLRVAAEAALVWPSSRETATRTCAQVALRFKTHLTSSRAELANRFLLFALPDSVGPWLPWSQWSACSVSCGGGQQTRTRHCSFPPCSGLSRHSKTCNTQVCLGESVFAVQKRNMPGRSVPI